MKNIFKTSDGRRPQIEISGAPRSESGNDLLCSTLISVQGLLFDFAGIFIAYKTIQNTSLKFDGQEMQAKYLKLSERE